MKVMKIVGICFGVSLFVNYVTLNHSLKKARDEAITKLAEAIVDAYDRKHSDRTNRESS